MKRARRKTGARFLPAWVLCLGVLGPGAGAHHELHRELHGGLQRERVRASAEDELSEPERAYYFELFARVARDCALECYDEVLGAVDRLHRNQLPLADAERLYRSLRARLPTVEVAWDGERAVLVAAPRLELTVGLARSVLVEVDNTSSSAHTLRASFQGWRPSNLTACPPGATRAMLAQVQTADASIQRIGLSIGGKGVSATVEVPVSTARPARLLGTVLDGDTGAPTAARVFVRGGDGELRHAKAYRGNATLSRKKVPGTSVKQYKLPFFYTRGSFEIELPPGEDIEVRVERGFEHDVVRTMLHLSAGEAKEVTLASNRFIDMLARGWVSADTHVHWVKRDWSSDEEIDLLRIVQTAEDLRVISNLALRRTVAGGDVVTMPRHAPMGAAPVPDLAGYLVRMGQELRNDPHYGHHIFLNITSSITPVSTGDLISLCAQDYPLNPTLIDEARAQTPSESRPAVVAAHGLVGAAAVDIATGRVDSIDQCTTQQYYDVLDCGFRLPLTNGSDHPSQTVGWGRCYVKVREPLTYGAWIDGILSGNTFKTSGPLIFLTVNGVEPGGELSVPAGEELRVRVNIESRSRIGRVEIVSNREVLYSQSFDERSAAVDLSLPADVSRWLVARCSAATHPSYAHERGAAHTSAVYVRVDGKEIFNDSGAAQRLRDACAAGGDDVYAHGVFHAPDADRKREAARDYFYTGRDIYQALVDRN